MSDLSIFYLYVVMFHVHRIGNIGFGGTIRTEDLCPSQMFHWNVSEIVMA